MKPLLSIMFFCCLFSHGVANESSSFAQNMTPETIIADAKTARTGAQATQLVEQVFQSKQLDLIAACFRAPNVHGIFVQEFVKLPTGQFKNDVIYTLLHQRWPFDATPDRPYFGSMPPPIFEDACLEILAAKLPNEGLFVGDPRSIEKIRDVNYRLELARKLEVIADPSQARTTEPSDENITSKQSQSGQTAAQDKTHVIRKGNGAQKSQAIPQEIGDIASNAASSTPWPVVALLIAAATGLLWLLVKRRK